MKKQNTAVKVRVNTKAKKSSRKVKRASVFSKLFNKANYAFRYVFIED